jgi:hypothetical protein
MTIDLNKLPLEGNEDGVPDLNEAFPFDPQHPFDLNIPIHEEQENQHQGTLFSSKNFPFDPPEHFSILLNTCFNIKCLI